MREYFVTNLMNWQHIEYCDKKENYSIWVYTASEDCNEDKIIYSDEINGTFEITEKDGQIFFTYLGLDNFKQPISIEEFLANRKPAYNHIVQIYISDKNTENPTNFQFLRELFLNYHSDKEIAEIFEPYGIDSRKKPFDESDAINVFNFNEKFKQGEMNLLQNHNEQIIHDYVKEKHTFEKEALDAAEFILID